MSTLRFDDFVNRFWSDARFRRAFAKDPRRKLREYGFDPDLFDIPETIDAVELETNLKRHQEAAEHPPEGVGGLSAAEAWRKATMLRLKPEAVELAHGASIVTAVGQTTSISTAVIYGTTATTQAHAVITSAGTEPGLKAETLERLQALRALARRKAAELTVSVTLDDGQTIDGLSVEAARALIDRMR